MAKSIIPQIYAEHHQKFSDIYEDLKDNLLKIQALSYVQAHTDFFDDIPEDVQKEYAATLYDFISSTVDKCEQLRYCFFQS